ncbi:MAG: AAA family ATPase [Planctomycetes bacterium]|nr:AAA family ATPase [Planctomycetota bacterium]
MRRRAWLILAVVLVGVVAALVLLATAPKRYCARGRLLFTVSGGRIPTDGKAASPVGGAALEWDMPTQMALLKTRSLAEAVGRKLKMADKWEFEADPPGYVSRAVLAVQSWIKGTIETTYGKRISGQESDLDIPGEIMDRVGVTGGADGRTIEVSFVGSHPEKIVRILDVLMETFIEMDTERRRSRANEALEWFQAKRHELQAAIAQREKQLGKQAKNGKPTTASGEKKGEDVLAAEKLERLSHALAEAETRRIQAEVLYQQLLKDDELCENPPRGAGGGGIQRLRARRDELVARRAVLAGKFGGKWPEVVKTDSELAGVNKQIEAGKKKVLSSAKAACDLAREKEKRLREAVERQKQHVVALGRKALQSREIEREIAATEKMADLLLASAKEVRGGEAADRRQVIIAAPAQLAGKVESRRDKVAAACLVVSAILVGIGLALLVERRNGAIRAEDDIETRLEVRALGSIARASPDLTGSNDCAVPLVTQAEPNSLFSKQFQELTVILLAQVFDNGQKTVCVTSISREEGRTTVAANLAICLAQLGRKALLVDSDMERPLIHKAFGLEKGPGFAEIARRGGADIHTVIQGAGTPNLAIVTAGSRGQETGEPSSPGADRLGRVLSRASAEFDAVVVDSAPIDHMVDGLDIIGASDSVLVVMRSGAVPRRAARSAIRRVEKANSNLVGIVLNESDSGGTVCDASCRNGTEEPRWTQ